MTRTSFEAVVSISMAAARQGYGYTLSVLGLKVGIRVLGVIARTRLRLTRCSSVCRRSLRAEKATSIRLGTIRPDAIMALLATVDIACAQRLTINGRRA